MPYIDGLRVKKKFGQHFLRDVSCVKKIVGHADLGSGASVLEIGCGDGFLTRQILAAPIERLWVYEIDSDWASYVRRKISDQRLHVIEENVLDADLSILKEHGTWVLVANLPYQITFPILHLLQKNRDIITSGVIMVQEEVAQKLLKKRGRGYGYSSLFFQYFFNWTLLDKVSPGCFVPPPKVESRLLRFDVRNDLEDIPKEQEFWAFVKQIFHQPRRTIRNNLKQLNYDFKRLDDDTLQLRAQQLDLAGLIDVWRTLID